MNRMSKYEAIFFDLDDTLFDYNLGEEYALKMALKDRGIGFGSEYINLFRSINRSIWSDLKMFSSINNLYNERFIRFSKEICEDVKWKDLRSKYDYYSSKPFLIDGAEDICSRLSKICSLYITTNGPLKIRKKRLKVSRISKYFKGIYSAEMLGSYKPNKRFFDLIINDLDINDRGTVLIVGNSVDTDVRGGENAGIDTCFFERATVNETSSVKPTYTINNLCEIEDIIGVRCNQ